MLKRAIVVLSVGMSSALDVSMLWMGSVSVYELLFPSGWSFYTPYSPSAEFLAAVGGLLAAFAGAGLILSGMLGWRSIQPREKSVRLYQALLLYHGFRSVASLLLAHKLTGDLFVYFWARASWMIIGGYLPGLLIASACASAVLGWVGFSSIQARRSANLNA